MNMLRTEDEWFRIIQECRASGLSDKDWCREQGISASSFYYNIRKFRKLACEVPDHNKQPVSAPSQEVVQLRISEDETALPAIKEDAAHHKETPAPIGAIHIECGDISITCPDGISSAMVCSVIHALQLGC